MRRQTKHTTILTSHILIKDNPNYREYYILILMYCHAYYMYIHKHTMYTAVHRAHCGGPSRIRHTYPLMLPSDPQPVSTIYFVRQHSHTPPVMYTTDEVPDKILTTPHVPCKYTRSLFIMIWLWNNAWW